LFLANPDVMAQPAVLMTWACLFLALGVEGARKDVAYLTDAAKHDQGLHLGSDAIVTVARIATLVNSWPWDSWRTTPGQPAADPKVTTVRNDTLILGVRASEFAIVNMRDSPWKKIHGEYHKCCCRSNILNKPDESTAILCEMSIVHRSDIPWVGCGQLKGRGYHAFNNMGKRYQHLPFF